MLIQPLHFPSLLVCWCASVPLFISEKSTFPSQHFHTIIYYLKKPVKGWVESSRHCAGCYNELVRNIGIDLHRVQWSQFRPTRFSTLRIAYAVAELKISQLPKAVCLVFLKSCLLRSAYKILEFWKAIELCTFDMLPTVAHIDREQKARGSVITPRITRATWQPSEK